MPTQPPSITAPVIDASVVIKQGVDTMIPLELELEEGETDTTVLEFATSDVAILKLYQIIKKKGSGTPPTYIANGLELKLTLTNTTITSGIKLIPNTHSIEFYLTNEQTEALLATADGSIELRGTFFLEDSQGQSRPCSGLDLLFQIEPSDL